MGFYASAFDSSDTKPAEDFNDPPAPDTPQGNLRGTVFDSQTGLPLAGVALRIGGATTETGAATAHRDDRGRRPLRDRRDHGGHLRQARRAAERRL